MRSTGLQERAGDLVGDATPGTPFIFWDADLSVPDGADRGRDDGADVPLLRLPDNVTVVQITQQGHSGQENLDVYAAALHHHERVERLVFRDWGEHSSSRVT